VWLKNLSKKKSQLKGVTNMTFKQLVEKLNELINHHQLQVVNLEELLEEERQAARMNENAANHVIAELRKEISRYREALEFYALGRHWITSLKDGRDYVNEYGERARKALEGEE